ncbi:related to Probable transporter MCH4 [Saccharomycodes ludwigii]|uniref:Related to Probable transporter MCH4 n=1 Tax=Saccharomycodes ludwigii TaxID=36035 RepID=A0A376B514_9ASCO|nr:hypothetical protein SCDLUD_005002 [Saccharomycodes ludwigii]KAH3898679.1 hypothetical protein SCDLUD_005002 [Saccharomycodes ludwigii]SSD59712.1 related to Probable transporter MCH4 [Saccharomycodes ludwigii]
MPYSSSDIYLHNFTIGNTSSDVTINTSTTNNNNDTYTTAFFINNKDTTTPVSKLKSFNIQETIQKEPDSEDIDSFPDGGWKAYSVVFGAFMGLVPMFGVINTLGAIQTYISREQLANVSSSTVSWIFSSYLAITFSSSVFVGAYFDRNGAFAPMVIGSVLFIAGLMAMANSKTIAQFILSFGVCSGIGCGMVFALAMSCVTTWFYRKRSTATSIASIGGSVGGVVFPIMLKKLFVEVGFAWAIRILAFICAGSLLCCLIFCKERVTEKPNIIKFKDNKERLLWYTASCFNWRYLLDWKFLFTTLATSLGENSITACTTYLASYSLMRGNSEDVSYLLITVVNIVGIFGRFIPGYLADKYFGVFNVTIVTAILCSLICFIIWLPFGKNPACLWVFACLYGFSSGSIFSLTAPLIGKISRTSDFGKRYSTAYLFEAITTLPIIPICGAIIGDGSPKNYNNFIIFSTMLMVAASVCYLSARFICVGVNLKKF